MEMNATETANFILRRMDDPRVIVGPLYNDTSKPPGYQLQMNVTTHTLNEGNLTEVIEFFDTPTQLAQSFRNSLILALGRLYLQTRYQKRIVVQDIDTQQAEAAAMRELADTGGGGLDSPFINGAA